MSTDEENIRGNKIILRDFHHFFTLYSSRPLPPPLDSDELIFEEKYRKQQVCDCHHQSPDKDHIEQVDAILPREIFFDLAIDPFEANSMASLNCIFFEFYSTVLVKVPAISVGFFIKFSLLWKDFVCLFKSYR